MCGTCGRQLLAECTCSQAVEMRAELAKLVAEGKTEQQIVEYFIAKYGSQEPLASPIDKGFNRLAWAVPVPARRTGGLVLVGTVAVRWSRRQARRRLAGRGGVLPPPKTPRSRRASTMSSATLTKPGPAPRARSRDAVEPTARTPDSSPGSSSSSRALRRVDRGRGAAARTAARGDRPGRSSRSRRPDSSGMAASAPAGAARRARRGSTGRRCSGRTRAALEREKALTLRAIKELEFDRAMGKVSERRLRRDARSAARARAAADAPARWRRGLQTLIERDLATLQRTTAARLDAPSARGVRRRLSVVRHGQRLRRAVLQAVRDELTGARGASGAQDAAERDAHATRRRSCALARARCSRPPRRVRRADAGPAQMSGMSMPVADLAAGTVTVRVIRQAIMNVIPGRRRRAPRRRRRPARDDGSRRPRRVHRRSRRRARAGRGGRGRRAARSRSRIRRAGRRRRAHDPRRWRRRRDAGRRRQRRRPQAAAPAAPVAPARRQSRARSSLGGDTRFAAEFQDDTLPCSTCSTS